MHLAFPSVPTRNHWIEEGLATYVESGCRARAGQLDPGTVWCDFVPGNPKGLDYTFASTAKSSGDTTVRFNRGQQLLAVAALAVDEDSGVFRKVTQDVRFNLVLFLFGVISRPFPAMITPRFLDYALLAGEIGAFQGAFFIGGFEDETISQV